MKGGSVFSCLSPQHCILDDAGDSPQGSGPPPLPPAIEIFPSDVVKAKPFSTESINLKGGLILLKGRVNTTDVFGSGNTDLMPGIYEGGLKLWECSLDLINTLHQEIKDGCLSFRGKRVLELGCGHGLPGIFACMKGASTIHFQDFNVEVLRALTISNVNANLEQERNRRQQTGSSFGKGNLLSPDIHFYAGDWADMDTLLSTVAADGDQMEHVEERKSDAVLSSSFHEGDSSLGQEPLGKPVKQIWKQLASKPSEKGLECSVLGGGYDIILMSETVYSITSLQKLYALIKKCLRPRYGVVYVAGKKYYFGVGGGTREFKNLVEEDGLLGAHLLADFADGSSNIREVWKFFFR